MLAVESLTAGYGAAPILQDVSLSIAPGELVAIVGANGAGKSTLLRTISGLLPTRAGRIRFSGIDIHGMAPERIAALGIAHVPEGRHVFPDQSTEDNLYLGAFRRSLREPRHAVRADIDAMFERFPALAERRKSLAGFLSGGEQQMLAIARALIGKPTLLMLDEPSLGLAPIVIESIFSLLAEESRRGTTILLVEQLANAALAIAGRGYVLNRGRVALGGPSRSLLENKEVRRIYLGVIEAEND
ncbi:MAG: ABC transporter ATP-binding protein [Alphaproteobacteria bacterium]